MPRHISSAEQISYRIVSALVDEAIAQTNTGDNNIYYAKKEATNLSSAGVQFPKRLTETLAASSANNIAEPNENVNTHEVNSSRPCFLLFLKTFSKVYIKKT